MQIGTYQQLLVELILHLEATFAEEGGAQDNMIEKALVKLPTMRIYVEEIMKM